MDYQKQNERNYKLIYAYKHCKNPDEKEVIGCNLYYAFKGLIHDIVLKLYWKYHSRIEYIFELDDLLAEAVIIFYGALESYNLNKKTPLMPWVKMCLSGYLLAKIKKEIKRPNFEKRIIPEDEETRFLIRETRFFVRETIKTVANQYGKYGQYITEKRILCDKPQSLLVVSKALHISINSVIAIETSIVSRFEQEWLHKKPEDLFVSDSKIASILNKYRQQDMFEGIKNG